jgi:hypothetical protein
MVGEVHMNKTPELERNDPAQEAKRVTFHYIKGSYFRSIHVDGAMASVGPAGDLHIAVYGERRAIPRTTIHRANADGTIADEETIVDGRDGFVRELEADLVMSKEVAMAVANWIRSAFGEANDDLRLLDQ